MSAAVANQCASCVNRPLLGKDVVVDPDNLFNLEVHLLSKDNPLFCAKGFITKEECNALVAAQSAVNEKTTVPINFVEEKDPDSVSSPGFRARVSPTEPALQPVLDSIQKMFGWEDRKFVFDRSGESRPNAGQIVVRDVTTVHYEEGQGTASHVDGSEMTVWVCLRHAEEGGATVFPKHDHVAKLWFTNAMVFSSIEDDEMIHYAEPVKKGTKWGLQLRIDYKY